MRIVEDGQLMHEFNGFEDEKVIFEFMSGNKWQQDEYKYNYSYGFMPRAKVVENMGQTYLSVDGMSEMVRVKKVY